MDRARDIMWPLFDQYEDCYDIRDALRSLASEGEITEEEYDMCQYYWDELLEEWEGDVENEQIY